MQVISVISCNFAKLFQTAAAPPGQLQFDSNSIAVAPPVQTYFHLFQLTFYPTRLILNGTDLDIMILQLLVDLPKPQAWPDDRCIFEVSRIRTRWYRKQSMESFPRRYVRKTLLSDCVNCQMGSQMEQMNSKWNIFKTPCNCLWIVTYFGRFMLEWTTLI